MKELTNGYFSLETRDYAENVREKLKLNLVHTLDSILKEIRYQASTYYKDSITIDEKQSLNGLKSVPLLKAANQKSYDYKLPDENDVYMKNIETYKEIECVLEELGYTITYNSISHSITIKW